MSWCTRPTTVRDALLQLDMEPGKSLGQNFLIDAHARDRVVEEAMIGPDDHVLEVGPGLGALTEALLERARRVDCIEIDSRLAGYLRSYFGTHPAFHLEHADALAVDLAAYFSAGANRFVSNLPYSVGSRILMEIAGMLQAPPRMVVTVQYDVAERLVAAPRTEAYGLLGIWLGIFYHVHIARRVKPASFMPAPRVDSAVVTFTHREDIGGDALARNTLLQTIKFCFTRRRKQLSSTHRAAAKPLAAQLDILFERGVLPSSRPEEVPIDTWRGLLSS